MAIDWQASADALLAQGRDTKYDCPRCGGSIPNETHRGLYPGALSRWDNETEICSQCGTDEAMIQFMAHLAQADTQHAVRPEARPWVKVPA